jgi:chitodextrinase
MKLMNLWVVTTMVCSLVLLTSVSVQAADETITDGIEDVCTYDYLSGETTVITSSPYIDVDNIDLMQSTYTQQGSQATLTLQVRGVIEDRGRIDYMEIDYDSLFNTLDSVDYMMTLTTIEQDSEQEYTVRYSNKTGQLTRGSETPVNLTSSDFSVAGDTLTVSFTLDSSQETYESLVVESTYVKMNLTPENPDFSQFVILSDISPNPPLTIYAPYAPNIGSVGETIQFNGSVEPLTGQPPYTYQWDFGDQTTSSALNPTHVYTKAGEYTFTFTVTDHGGATESESGTITIESENNGSSGSSTPMLLFLAILAIVIVIGVIIIIWIIRR